MSQALTTQALPMFALQVGTKKAPVSFDAPRIGVALAAGKAGTEARKAEKADMAQNAANGGFHVFAGFLAATFPKASAAYQSATASQLQAYRDMLKGEIEDDKAEWLEGKIAQLTKASSPTNREGFTIFVQCVLNYADQTKAKPAKLTKAQAEALEQVHRYISLVEQRQAEAAARRAAQRAEERSASVTAEIKALMDGIVADADDVSADEPALM